MDLQVTEHPKEKKAPSADYRSLVSRLRALVVTNLVASQRLSLSAFTVFTKCFERITAAYALGSSVKGQEN